MERAGKSNPIPIHEKRKEKLKYEPGDEGVGLGFNGIVGDFLVEVSEDLRQRPRDARRCWCNRVKRDHVIGDRHFLLLTTADADAVDVRVRVLVLESANGKQEPSLFRL